MEITNQKFKELQRAKEKLDALEVGGVENWEWYGESLKDWHAENELEENREILLEELSGIFGECAYEPSERGAGIAFRDEAYDEAMRLLVKLGVCFNKV
jgi:hypothetical protein